MKKILTAIGNPNLNEKLSEEENLKIICKDIIYKEAIIEIMQENKNIDVIVISESIYGEISFEELIKNIKKINNNIRIIFILENQNEKLKNILIENNINDIYYNNEINLQQLIEIIKKDKIKTQEELEKEIQMLKEIILNNNKNNINNITNANSKKGEIVVVTGIARSGKSIFTINFANFMTKKNKKTLIIDFNLFSQDIFSILEIERNKKEEFSEFNDIQNYIKNYNKKINILSGLEFVYNKKIKNNININYFIENLKNNYNLIIIEMTTELNLNIEKELIKNCDKIVFLTEGNILEIKKTTIILENYINKLDIDNQKIKIIINKYNNKNIDMQIIKNILKNYSIIGKIKYNKYYNYLINNNYNNNLVKNIIKLDYLKLIK